MSGLPAPVLMVQGTASGVGKSLLTAALCRIARRRGIEVAPFKAQNMSNNAAVTAEGGEIGRAQWLQALAAGVEPTVDMNPVLLKPMADTRSAVVVRGRHDEEASRMHWRQRRDRLWPAVTGALGSLRSRYELVVAEGAGSPAETNLRENDIVNMAVARHADAAVLLVADIDRGGAFAALYGTWALLEEDDRRLFRGFVLNRFRGDASLLAPAPRDLEVQTGVPVVGVVPWIRHLLPEEDGGPDLNRPVTAPGNGDEGSARPPVQVGVVAFPRASNIDDLDPLRTEPGLTLRRVERPRDLAGSSALILPGSRSTAADLRWMRESGLADAVRGWARDGLPVVGLCGGYQMMGRSIEDPEGIEEAGSFEGLGLLDITTTLSPDKDTRLTRGRVTDVPRGLGELREGSDVEGYEIHHGRTFGGPGGEPWVVDAEDGRVLGHSTGRHWGCYLHGVFAVDELRRAWLRGLGVGRYATGRWERRLDVELERVADHVEEHLDVDRVLEWVGRGRTSHRGER